MDNAFCLHWPERGEKIERKGSAGVLSRTFSCGLFHEIRRMRTPRMDKNGVQRSACCERLFRRLMVVLPTLQLKCSPLASKSGFFTLTASCCKLLPQIMEPRVKMC